MKDLQAIVLLASGMAMLLLALFLTSCEPEPDGCEHLDTRCKGQEAQLCNADQNWELSMDCANSENLVCCLGEYFGVQDYYCYLEEECLEE